MSSLFGRTSSKTTTTPASAFQVQTSVQGLPIPLVWGKARISGNIIYYGDFAAIPHNASGGGKGGLVGGGSGGKGGGQVSYTYQVAVALGLCQGPIKSVDALYIDKAVQSPASQNFVTFAGDYAQVPWGYLASLHPGQALANRGLAYVAAGPLQLGSSTELPNLGFEVHSAIADAVAGAPDADPSAVITDLLTNPNYGIGLPASRIGDLSAYTAYCRATGMLVSPVITDLTNGQDFIRSLLEATNAEAVWSQGQFTIVPRGDAAITAGTIIAVTEQHTVPPSGTIILSFPGNFVADGGVVDPSSGNVYGKTGIGSPLSTTQYWENADQGAAGSNTYQFSANIAGAIVAISYSYAEPTTYTPPAAPLYAFGDDDYLVAGSNNDLPVRITRSAPQDAKNSVVVNYLDRSNAYALTPTPAAKDDAAIQAYGLKPDAIRDYQFFKFAQAAQQSAQLALGRNAVRNSYVWTVGPRYKLLDPMDLVALTDSATGLNAQWVRILEIAENADLSLAMTGEDYLSGTAAAPVYGSEPAAGYTANYERDPGFVNAPVIFEPPSTLTGGDTELWIAVSGASNVWGGCDTYVSYDDTNYTLVPDAHLVGACRHGVSTAALSTDPAATLAVDISRVPGAQLTSVTAAEAQNLATLCWIDGELLAFTTATLTALGCYTLGGLVRGCYGTPVKAHAAGLPFARLDASIIKVPYNKALIGGGIFLKFLSFNLWGRGGQSLSTVTAIEYTFAGGQPPGVITGIKALAGQSGLAVTLTASWSPDALSTHYQAGVSSDGGQTWGSVYDGADTSVRFDGLKAAPLVFRVRGVTSSGIAGTYASVSLAAPPLTSAGSGYVEYISYKDVNASIIDNSLSNDLQADLNELAQFATLVSQDSLSTQALARANAATSATIQLSSGQLPSITASLGLQSTGLVQQILAVNQSLTAQIAKEAADVTAANGRIDTLSQTIGGNSAFTTGISTAQAGINTANAIRLDELAAIEGTDNDSGELAQFVALVQQGNIQAVKDAATAAARAAIVVQQISNTNAAAANALYGVTLAAQISGSLGVVNNTLSVQATGLTSLANQLSGLQSIVGDPTSGVSATYTGMAATRAVVNDQKLGNQALATSLQQVTATSNAGTASGQVGFSAQSAPSGVTARFAMTLSVTGQQTASGGIYADLVNGTVAITLQASAFRIEDPSSRFVPFGVSGGKLYLQGLTYIASTVQSTTTVTSASTGQVSPVMVIDFQNGLITINDAG